MSAHLPLLGLDLDRRGECFVMGKEGVCIICGKHEMEIRMVCVC